MIGNLGTKNSMSIQNYNNIGIASLAICSTLQHASSLTVPKSLLIMPLVSHNELLSYLARKTTDIKSIEKLIVDKVVFFANFNKRYYDCLLDSLNAIQFLSETSMVEVEDGALKLLANLEYASAMGDRAQKIFQASKNISEILKNSVENLYLNLRVEL